MDISRKDGKALVGLCNALIKPNPEDRVYIKGKLNSYWK